MKEFHMIFRIADMNDLYQLKMVYSDIVNHMYENNIKIWDEVYPTAYFNEDIKNQRLYVLEDHDTILSAFALSDRHSGENHIKWPGKGCKALYLDRLGVHINYTGMGIGSIALEKAAELAKSKGASCLRLFVVDFNKPAINLYEKNGFKKADGVYDEIIEEGLVFHELGYEKCI